MKSPALATQTIRNPILPGFNPDPSIVRVGRDYYIATSTFEWYPGVQIHHSRDLAHWELVTRPLAEERLLEMRGNPDSGGVWAPCLSHDGERFYLIYTNMRSWDEGPYKIAYNYLTTAETIEGPWSDPVFLTGSGFDPSLFHDDDGRKWLLNQQWDHRDGVNNFAGILLQEYDADARQLVGPVKSIFDGTPIGLVEGPHLYKANGFYYLLTAEGGTQYEHAATLARSERIDGPYEVHPQNPLLSAHGAADAPLHKAGHASLVETPEGEWYLAHLCGRPIDGKHCVLGRETAIQKCRWREDGWLELDHGGSVPALETPAPAGVEPEECSKTPDAVTFSPDHPLDPHFQTLRRPFSESWISLSACPGRLRLYGGEPTVSLFEQSLVARRIQAFRVEVETCLDFNPLHFQHMAGLIAYYDTQNHYYLRVSRDESVGRCLNIIACDAGNTREVLPEELALPPEGPIHLGLEYDRTDLRFRFSSDGTSWSTVGPALPAHILSDDYQKLGFTGAFVGMCCQDITGQRHPADFRFFRYQEKA